MQISRWSKCKSWDSMSGLQIIGPQVTQTLFWITVERYFSSKKTVDCKVHFLSWTDTFNAFRISGKYLLKDTDSIPV